jgi:hypothetical protein
MVGILIIWNKGLFPNLFIKELWQQNKKITKQPTLLAQFHWNAWHPLLPKEWHLYYFSKKHYRKKAVGTCFLSVQISQETSKARDAKGFRLGVEPSDILDHHSFMDSVGHCWRSRVWRLIESLMNPKGEWRSDNCQGGGWSVPELACKAEETHNLAKHVYQSGPVQRTFWIASHAKNCFLGVGVGGGGGCERVKLYGIPKKLHKVNMQMIAISKIGRLVLSHIWFSNHILYVTKMCISLHNLVYP